MTKEELPSVSQYREMRRQLRQEKNDRIEEMLKAGVFTISEIASMANVSDKTVQRRKKKMVEAGLL